VRHIGAKVDFDREARTMTVDARQLVNNSAPYELMNQMRASFLVLGPILQRMREAMISLPGGCSLGPRPVNYHIQGFKSLGAEVSEEKGYIIAKAKRLKGGTIYFDRPSHTGTENLMYGAVMAEARHGLSTPPAIPKLLIWPGT